MGSISVVVWLVALPTPAADWQSGEGYRFKSVSPEEGSSRLTLMGAAETGLLFTNQLSEDRALESSLRTNGSGVAAGDVDGDGLCDLYFCGLDNANVLYRNLGNWRFEDITGKSGVACPGQDSTGAALVDVDGDRDVDLLVNSIGHGTRLFLNDGKGVFQEAANTGLLNRYGATSMALADVDGNGTLDLYVANYATTKIEDRPNARFETKRAGDRLILSAIDGVPTSSPELTNRYFIDVERVVRELGEPDAFYLGDGHGKFKLISWTDGAFVDEQGKPFASPHYDFGLSVMFRDMNGDGAPDIYICNDLFPPDRIWVNDGRGKFQAMSSLSVRQTCRFAMGVDFADINRDGYDDFFVVDMLSRQHSMRKVQTVGVLPIFLPIGLIDHRPQYKRNTLFLGRPDGTYAEIAQLSGVEATEWSWMPAFLDVDLDGFEDLLVTTGHTRDSLNADAVAEILRERSGRRLTDLEHRALKKKHYPLLHVANQAFRNRGDLTFEDKGTEWGCDHRGVSHGMCLADLDNDGDLDVVVNNLNDAAGVYRFDSARPRIAVRLKGMPPNTQGIGARIRILGGPLPQAQEVMAGGRYVSGDEGLRMFAVPQDTSALRIEVKWRNGAVSVVRSVKANTIYEVDEAGSAPGTTNQPATRSPAVTTFVDVSALLQHVHVETPFDDFERQPLLTRRMSQLGPGVGWYDLDGDGHEELMIGSGAGGKMAVFQPMPGGFRRLDAPVLHEGIGRDQTSVIGFARGDGSAAIIAGSSNYEDGQPRGSLALEYLLDQPTPRRDLPGSEVSTGPLAMADVDGDGILDLFVGGRVEPARYPDAPSSLLFRGTRGKFEFDPPTCKELSLIGMVSGAVFTDLDQDGDPDLVVSCDWGPLKFFRNDRSRLVKWEWRVVTATNLPPFPISQLTGLWNGIAAGDFDGDGRIDLVAGNWGRNSRYETFRRRPLQLYYGEWTTPGVVDAIEGYFDPGLNKVVPWAPYRTARLIPWIVERYQTATAYSTAGVLDLLGERSRSAKVVDATWLESTVFLNRGDHFVARPLPIEAQFSPAFGVVAADLDGDGNDDIFLSQNFQAVDGDTSRYDAGRGLLLQGDGRGSFRSVPAEESGLKIYGEQRGAAVCDYDEDGRLDLVVTQNGAETKLYRNTGAKPGLRVRMKGPATNPTGVGVVLRPISGTTTGPAREVRAGGGYWSQDSPVQVFGAIGRVSKIQVQWPRGRSMTVDVPPEAREVTIDTSGKIVSSK